MDMKRLISTVILAVAILATQSCGVMTPSQPNELAVNAKVETGIYITVNSIYGKSGRPVFSSGEYYLNIEDSKVSSYLPFFGESYGATSGYGTTSGIEFDKYPVRITETRDREMRVWTFTAEQGQESIKVTIEFSDSGNASITCTSSTRSVMRYSGEITSRPER